MTALPITPSWHAENRPNGPAVVMGATGETVSYAELEDRSSRLARALRSRGVGDGDGIAILMENNPVFLEVAWAASAPGCTTRRSAPTCAGLALACSPRSENYILIIKN